MPSVTYMKDRYHYNDINIVTTIGDTYIGGMIFPYIPFRPTLLRRSYLRANSPPPRADTMDVGLKLWSRVAEFASNYVSRETRQDEQIYSPKRAEKLTEREKICQLYSAGSNNSYELSFFLFLIRTCTVCIYVYV